MPVKRPKTTKNTATMAASRARRSLSQSFCKRYRPLHQSEITIITYMANHIGTWKKRLRSVRPSPGIRGKGRPKPSTTPKVIPNVAMIPATRISQKKQNFLIGCFRPWSMVLAVFCSFVPILNR